MWLELHIFGLTQNTVKKVPVFNDHFYNVLPVIDSVMYFDGDWRFQFTLANNLCPWPPRWAPESREVTHYVVVIDRFHCSLS